jgi:hypothetical protein
VGHVGGADDRAADDRGLAVDGRLEVDRLPLEVAEQQLLADRVVPVVLFPDPDRDLAGGIAEDDRVGLELGGDAVEGDVVHPLRERDADLLADDGELLVVEGERRGRLGGPLGLGKEKRRRQEEPWGCFHGPSLATNARPVVREM